MHRFNPQFCVQLGFYAQFTQKFVLMWPWISWNLGKMNKHWSGNVWLLSRYPVTTIISYKNSLLKIIIFFYSHWIYEALGLSDLQSTQDVQYNRPRCDPECVIFKHTNIFLDANLVEDLDWVVAHLLSPSPGRGSLYFSCGLFVRGSLCSSFSCFTHCLWIFCVRRDFLVCICFPK